MSTQKKEKVVQYQDLNSKIAEIDNYNNKIIKGKIDKAQLEKFVKA